MLFIKYVCSTCAQVLTGIKISEEYKLFIKNLMLHAIIKQL